MMKRKMICGLILLMLSIGLVAAPVSAQNPLPAAYIKIDPPGNSIDGSTYGNGSFVIRNDSTGGLRIAKVTFDLSTAILRKMIFDPDGTGGDLVAKDFTPNSGKAPTGQFSHAFTKPFNAQNQGYYGLEINFNNFDPGETFTFSVDVDPASTRGIPAPGPGESGSVSGLELVSATITVNFSNGSTYSGQLYRLPNTPDASQNTIGPASSALAKPVVTVLGLNTPTTVNTASQTVRVSGPVGANIGLMIMESALYTPICAGCTAAPYEANSAVAVNEVSGTIGSSGHVDLPVTLTRSNASAGLNYMVAVVKGPNSINGPTSDVVVVKYDPSLVINQPPVANDDSFTTERDSTLTGNVLTNDSDPDGDTLTAHALTQPTHGTLALNTNGNFTYQPGAGYVGQDSFTYEARDGRGGTDSATVTITITDIPPVELPPVAVDDAYMTFEGVTLRVNRNQGVLANDSDPQDDNFDLRAALLTSPAGWAIDLQPNGAFTLTPADGFTGTEIFTYSVTNSRGLSATGTVMVTVEPLEAPIELLMNGTFEDKSISTPRNPAVWNGTLQNTDRLRCNRINHPGGLPDKIFAHEGDCAFRFLGAPGKNSRLMQSVSTDDLQAGDTVTFVGYLKANNLPANTARIIIRAVYPDQPNQNLVIIPQAGTYQTYLQFSGSMQLHSQPRALRVIVRYSAPRGALWLDMFSLRVQNTD